jgi:hypothetical protein
VDIPCIAGEDDEEEEEEGKEEESKFNTAIGHHVTTWHFCSSTSP